MTIQTTTQKAAETAHNVAEGVFDKASETLQSTRRMTNESIDKAETRVQRMQEGVDPMIDDLAAKAQDLATRGISYCAHTGERARRQFHQAADATNRYVTEQPGKSLLIAAAAGAAFATALMWTRHRGERY
ncbi:hypothetical protein QY917_10705 [Diaphorobacter sp. C33]|uniref:ElaB/YqjD/DUF883 family membrane-anchored ribosome-binding protein n=1 Tax=Diaphorobacter nitroreducens TaxID=164759 RepID=A0AAX1WTE1_9BURK|nr:MULTISPECIES: hypothetical protein [unclassified Diaphorobacter]ROR41751.1 ElaB/YqjD/DUF883 family membrane-anchored ribosome-binding protein [Diaphorobacter nitroreducens]WKK88320.1 hypothetical protein QY917_10705 [Diaphorobacter sp. C33]